MDKLGLLYQIKKETNAYKLSLLFSDYFNKTPITKEQFLKSNKKYILKQLKKDAMKTLEEYEKIMGIK